MAPSDEGAGVKNERLRERKTDFFLILSLRLLLRKIHLPRQREAFFIAYSKGSFSYPPCRRGGRQRPRFEVALSAYFRLRRRRRG